MVPLDLACVTAQTPIMLITVLVVLAIIALLLFILRGSRL
jgi:hypothetical protein